MLFFNFEKDLIAHLKNWVSFKHLKKVQKIPPNVIVLKLKHIDQPIVFMSGKSIIAEEMIDLDKMSWQ